MNKITRTFMIMNQLDSDLPFHLLMGDCAVQFCIMYSGSALPRTALILLPLVHVQYVIIMFNVVKVELVEGTRWWIYPCTHGVIHSMTIP